MGSMNELNALIEQMVMDISGQAFHLDDLRLQMFLNWMSAHSSKVKTAVQMDSSTFREAKAKERFKSTLKSWFESIPMQGVLWEFHIIMDEISWWRDLDPGRLVMMTDEMQ